MGWFLKFLAVLIILCAIIVGVFIYTLRQPPPLARQMRPVASTAEAASSFDAKWNDLEEYLRNGRATPGSAPAPREVVFTEAEISAKINALINEQANAPAGQGSASVASSWIPLRDVQLNFQATGQLVRGTAFFDYQGFSGRVAAEAQGWLDNGKLRMDLQSVQVGGAGLPEGMKQQARNGLQNYAARVQIPDWIQDICITSDGQVTIVIK